mmetsp:Transcript_25686/g.52603  ORF Transcript_25686/g.52603 Transcript_25686/m.52603 type:complete len:341 (-) Transcript_25686:124-1146(-)
MRTELKNRTRKTPKCSLLSLVLSTFFLVQLAFIGLVNYKPSYYAAEDTGLKKSHAGVAEGVGDSNKAAKEIDRNKSDPSVAGGPGKLSKIGFDGGAWTAETHLSQYGFNVDWGLLELLESSCRDIENSRIPEGEAKWEQWDNGDPLHPLFGWWKAPQKKYITSSVLEVGCGVGVYVDALKKEQAKKGRRVIGIEPNPMGGTFLRGRAGPKQLAINFLDAVDTAALAREICDTELGSGKRFDLIYSIEVFEHLPLDRHEDAVKFLAASARKGTKLIFGAGSPGQQGVGHIGLRKKDSWEIFLAEHNFEKSVEDTGKATRTIQEYNHRVNTQVYYYGGEQTN